MTGEGLVITGLGCDPGTIDRPAAGHDERGQQPTRSLDRQPKDRSFGTNRVLTKFWDRPICRSGSSALLEGHHMALLLLGAGALLVSGGTLAAMHLLLQSNKQRRWSTDGKDTPVEEEDLALVLSEEEEMGPAEGQDDEQPQQQSQHGQAVEGETRGGTTWTEARGERLSRRARLRRRNEKLVGPHIEVCRIAGVCRFYDKSSSS